MRTRKSMEKVREACETLGITSVFDLKKYDLEIHEYEKGEIVVSTDQPLTCLMFIISGELSIFDITENGDFIRIASSSTGEILGEWEMVEDVNTVKYGEAITPLKTLAIPFANNKAMMKKDPVVLWFLLKRVTKKINDSTVLLSEYQTLSDRVLFYLDALAADHCIHSVSGTARFLRCSNRQLLRILKQFCEAGVIEKTGKGEYVKKV